jgi:hypothetical protein
LHYSQVSMKAGRSLLLALIQFLSHSFARVRLLFVP